MRKNINELPQNLQKVIYDCRKSNFNFPAERNNINMNSRNGFIKALNLWCDYQNHESNEVVSTENLFKKIIPEFQRDNNKWNEQMKISFVENLLKGCDTYISLYKISEHTHTSEDCLVLDGFQRLTAIFDFLDNKIKVFGLTYDELSDALPIFNTRIFLKIYTFDNIENVGRFYVEMNENITHSSDDINKAKNFFKSHYDIVI